MTDDRPTCYVEVAGNLTGVKSSLIRVENKISKTC